MILISRQWALATGFKYYFTGRPCKRGHVAERLVSTRKCVECNRASTRAWRRANPAKNAAINRAWQKTNSGRVNAHTAKRAATKRRATPPWLTREHDRAVTSKYVEAAKYKVITGVDWHVDHIIPLQNKRVCGLHVPWNLRVIPAVDNHAKHNHLIEDPK